MKLVTALFLSLTGLSACSQSPSSSPPGETPAETREARLRQLHEALDALAKKAEHQALEVEVQDILVAVAGRTEGATRSPVEAEGLTAELYARALAGEQFDTLERNYSSDVHPGIYRMSAQPTQITGVIPRQDMMPGFGDVAWRLGVGEIGVAAYDEERSPFGFHILKRLK